ncbi:MAG TPA: TetR/AcrR family transcriptional regulator [Methylobacter sp.]
MKVSREKSAENRELVLDTAARMFKEHGFDGIGVVDLMKNAGLTAGGFYNNFESKEDLMAQACKRASEKSLARWQEHIDNPEIADPLKRIGTAYLSPKNRDDLGSTCLFSTLGSEVGRHNPAVRQVFTQSIEATIALLIPLMAGETDSRKRENAIAVFSQWLGSLILSRATAGNALSDEILRVAREKSGLD